VSPAYEETEAVGRVYEREAANYDHYPDGVRLPGIEVVPAMLDIARRRAVAPGRSVDFRLGDAQALEFEDATFDTVVCTLSLCTIPGRPRRRGRSETRASTRRALRNTGARTQSSPSGPGRPATGRA
jgi:Methyltransferase domain